MRTFGAGLSAARTGARVLVSCLIAVSVLASASTHAQGLKHLKCYKVRDSLKLGGTVDLATAHFGADPGCQIKKATLYCVPSDKTNVAVVDKVTGQPITPQSVAGVDLEDLICYKVKCAQPVGDQVVVDQLGTHTLTKLKPASMLCMPAVPSTSTTTSTTTTSTTTTTNPLACCQISTFVGGACTEGTATTGFAAGCADANTALVNAGFGGATYNPGTVCNGATGACVVSGDGVSYCCQVPSFFGSAPFCTESPGFLSFPSICTSSLSGTLFSGQKCNGNSGQCYTP